MTGPLSCLAVNDAEQDRSSELSLQSSCPSHTQMPGMQIPLSHLKSPCVHSANEKRKRDGDERERRGGEERVRREN